VRNSRRVTELNVGDDALHLFGQDTHDFSLNSFTHAYSDVANGRFEAASESKIKNAKQIVLYALGFLCFPKSPAARSSISSISACFHAFSM
jgi:hypothetical protein